MSEAVEKYAEERAKECRIEEKITSTKNVMDSFRISVDQALDALKIQGTERELITQQLNKQQ